jgi:hypothetical protein
MKTVSISDPQSTLVIPVGIITEQIFLIRGQKVMLDADLAELYEVPTKALNQAVKRNINRFPDDFMFQLNSLEIEMLNQSQFVTGSQRHRDPRSLPYAFTAHGVAMLSSVLKSKRAVEMNIFIIRAFIKLRDILSSNKELERDQKNQNRHINRIYSVIDTLLKEPVKPVDPIGFDAKS